MPDDKYYLIIISLFLLIQILNAKVLLIASVFRHGQRLSYINFSSNKREDNALTQIGKLTAYEAGKKFIYLNSTIQPVQASDIICYQESIDSPRTMQTLALRLAGMLNKPFEDIMNYTNSAYEEYNRNNCNLKPKKINLFPKKECKILIDQQLILNRHFNYYVKTILQTLRHNELFTKYLNSNSYYKDNKKESMYDKLNLIADYLSLGGRGIKGNNSKEEEEEENEMRTVFNNYQQKYFKAILESNNVIDVMVAKYFESIMKEINELLESKPNINNDNRVKYLLFSSHEFSLLSILESLKIIDTDKPQVIEFNDEINLSLIQKENMEFYIVVYYNNKMMQMKHCDIYCPLSYFKNVIINKYLLITDDQINSLCSQSAYNDEL